MLPVALLLLFQVLNARGASGQVAKCGVASAGVGTAAKIVGGTAASTDQYPWFIALVPSAQFSRAQGGSSSPLTVFCGATLITAKHALSAAHCFAAFQAQGGNWKKKLTAVFGLKNRCTPSWKDFSTFSNVIIHAQYNGNTVKNDISLIFLAKDMSRFAPICFPPAGAAQHTGDVTIIGYGTVRENAQKSPCTLLQATVNQYTRRQCLSTQVGIQIRNLPGVVCAGLKNGSADSCQGDSGGPMMSQSKGVYTLEGIVSFGNGCARRNNPGVYTNVAYYRNWVTSRLNNARGSTPSSNRIDYSRWVTCIMNFNVRPCLAPPKPTESPEEDVEYNLISAEP